MFNKTKEKFKASTKDSIENVNSLKSLLDFRLKNFLKNRDVKQTAFENNFDQVLVNWGIEEEEIEEVCSGLKIRSFAFFFILIIALILCIQVQYILGGMLAFCALLGISTALWRMSVLKNRTFIPYIKCLLLLVFFKKFPKS